MTRGDNLRVAVVGTGTVGAMTLWRLARRGIRATGFDRYAPGHDRGAAGGETRIFRTAYREGAAYVPLLQRAERLWRELESASGRSLLTMSGGLTLGHPDHPDVRQVLGCIEEFGLEHERLDRHQMARRHPEHPLREGELGILDLHAGVLRPELSVAVAAAEAERLGATVQRYDAVHEVVPEGDRVLVRSDSGEHVFDHVVLAPGPWPNEQKLLDFVPLEVHQITTYWFLAADPTRYSPARMPIAIRCGEPGYSCFPTVDGLSVKVSLHSTTRPRIGSAGDLTRSGPDGLLPAVRAAVRQFMPGLLPDPVRVSSYADCFSPDGHGLVGPLPGNDTITVMAGFSGHGFKLSPVLGEIAADLVAGRGTSSDIAHLTPARFG